MSILLGIEIIEEYYRRKIIIEPFNEDYIGPNSIDVTLSDILLAYTPCKVTVPLQGKAFVEEIANPQKRSTVLDMTKINKNQ